MAEIEINLTDLAKAKTKKKVYVKPTTGRKGHYRTQEVGIVEKPSEGTSLKIKSKSGVEIPLIVSGTRDNPTIKVDGSFIVGGNKVTGTANIQHWKSKGAEEGLFFGRPKAYVQCADEIGKVKDVVSKLPADKYMAEKVDVTVDADGQKISTGKWQFDKLIETESGTLIPDWNMASFLDAKGIDEIEIADAAKMWADEKDAEYLSRNIEGNKMAEVMFDADVIEVGYQQASENAGIPKNLR